MPIIKKNTIFAVLPIQNNKNNMINNEGKTEANIRFGRKVASLRVERGLSQKELADACGLNRTYIGTIERAEKSATVNTIVKLAEGLGISPRDFFC